MIGLFIAAFVVITVGFAFLESTADTISPLTSIQTRTNETSATVTAGGNQTYLLQHGNLSATPTVRNATHQAYTNFTVNLTRGAITTGSNLNGASAGNTNNSGAYYTDYTYTEQSYLSDNSSRSIIGIVIIFFALGIVMAVFAIVSPAFRDFMGSFGK